MDIIKGGANDGSEKILCWPADKALTLKRSWIVPDGWVHMSSHCATKRREWNQLETKDPSKDM